VTGFGDFVNVDGYGNAKGYDFTTGGVSLGIDYRITGQLAIGAMGEYSHTWTLSNGAVISTSIAGEGVYMRLGSIMGFISMEQSTAVTTTMIRAAPA
jgi:outer membrane autotransporter protein